MKKHTESGNILQFRRPESQLLRRHRGLFKSPRKPTHQAQATVDAYKAFVTALSESLYAMPSIHFPVPNGIITVQMSHGVTSRTAREALALIRQAILENGIPKDPMVQVTGVDTRGAKEKSSEPRRHSFVEANTKRPNDAKMRVDTEEPSEENRVIEAMSDEELEAEVAKIRDMHVIQRYRFRNYVRSRSDSRGGNQRSCTYRRGHPENWRSEGKNGAAWRMLEHRPKRELLSLKVWPN